eukprot:GHUV01024908.1.p1 GENE.GHUV01024908.1~~GHUV01024908.1.p1  ORF type:complete len:329 (+),score=115.82 GHUV01024908.1:267-1253(+)
MFGSSGSWSCHPSISKTRLLKLGAGVASIGVAGSLAYRQRDRIASARVPLNSTVVEALAGAAGEVAQMALLYPLDTVKVRCQAASLSSRKVLAEMYRSTGGNWPAIFGALYAGILPSMALSVLVGSVHYACFCATRRVLSRLAAAAAADSRSSSQPSAQGVAAASHAQHVMASHGATGTHYMTVEDDQEERHEQQQQDQQLQQPSSNTSSKPAAKQKGMTATATAAASGGAQHVAQEGLRNEGSMAVNVASAVITAALTAVFEAPLELFRHNSQAGQIQGNFVKEMWKVSRLTAQTAGDPVQCANASAEWPVPIFSLTQSIDRCLHCF